MSILMIMNKMKKYFICILSLFCMTTAMAQEPAICGDWIGVYKSDAISDDVDSEGSKYIIQKDYKRYIRIKLIDGSYTVRMKTRIADESSPFTYSPECHVIEANDRMIRWKMDLGSSYDWTPSDKHKGIPIGHADYYKYCTIILGKREANFHLKHRSALMNYMVRIFTIQHSAQLLTRVINT